ncbi:MAG: Crp/Fnr family transcriptional regulator [Candidatus Muirbacterium halophilum]|nr:Crp/Fnr family transcriptional regulator [Candidatus Muirbacterium halophilum]MCK9475060.1 Crp/Fnr family transcriptional regulator [Candidatus Muirbacterium halophilum]
MFRTLVRSYIFKNISPETLEKDFEKINYKIVKYTKNSIIMYRDDNCNSLAILISGNIKTEMQDINGNIIPFEKFTPISVIAPAFLFGINNKYPVDIICESENSEVLFISKEDVIKLMHKNSTFMVNYIDAVCNKAYFLTQKISFSFFYKTISQKFAKYLLQKKDDKKELIEMTETIQEIADLFNVTRPSLSRIISEFVNEKIIRKEKRNLIKILDYNKLIQKLD